MGKRKSKRNQKKRAENISRNSALEVKPNGNAKAKMISVSNDISELSDIKNQSEIFQHGMHVTAASVSCDLEPHIKETSETLKDGKALFKGEYSNTNMFQRNVLPETASVEKPLEQNYQYTGKQIINSNGNLYSDSYDTESEDPSYLRSNFESYKKCITYENYASKALKNSEDCMYGNLTSYNDYENFPTCSNSVTKFSKKHALASMNAYTKSKNYFSSICSKWLLERKETLEKLKSLLSDLHNDQLMFNKTQAMFRGVSYSSRLAKCNQQSQIVDFIASLGAVLSEASSGVASVAQAYNIDCYQNKFEEIMNHDAEITKGLYEARSQCIMKYQGVEEVIRTFHADTFDSTVDKITDALEIDKFGIAVVNAYGKGDMSKLINIVNKFANNACESEVLEKIGDSLKSYVSENPAALEACKSVTRAAYEIIDVWSGPQNRSRLMEGARTGTNHMLMVEDRVQLERLKFSIDEDLPQTKLESRIEDAIENLEHEMEEIKDMYCELF